MKQERKYGLSAFNGMVMEGWNEKVMLEKDLKEERKRSFRQKKRG